MEDIILDDIESMLVDGDRELEFNIEDFEITIDNDENKKNRTIKPKLIKNNYIVDYKNAKDLAKKTILYQNEQMHAIVRGDFIFGDYIEALFIEKNIKTDVLYISTLSLSQNNIDSLKLLLLNDYVKKIVLIVSNYFYSHEKNNLIKYLITELNYNSQLELIVIRNHTKITLFEVSNINIIITGSANLRSSNSYEQLLIQENKELYNFYKNYFDSFKNYNILEG